MTDMTLVLTLLSQDQEGITKAPAAEAIVMGRNPGAGQMESAWVAFTLWTIISSTGVIVREFHLLEEIWGRR